MTTRTEGVPTPHPDAPPAASAPGEAPDPVLLVRLGAIGDVVRTLPALDRLRRSSPGLAVDWLVEEGASVLLRDHPDLRRVIVFPRKEISRAAAHGRLWRAAVRLQEAVAALRGARYGAVIDFQGSLKSGLLTYATGCARRVGLAAGHGREGSHLFYTDCVDPGRERISRVERNLRLLRRLGMALPEDAPPPVARMALSESDHAWARGVLDALCRGDGARILLYPGTSARQSYKRWPAERYGFLAGRLRDDGYQVLVAGGPGEEPMVDAVLAATSTPPARVPRSSLTQLAALLAGVDLFVGGDTGPMHIAWAMGTRVLGLFGATDPVINAPWDAAGPEHRVLYHGPQERPYRVKGQRARAWMEAIGLEEVHAACRELAPRAAAGRSAGKETGR